MAKFLAGLFHKVSIRIRARLAMAKARQQARRLLHKARPARLLVVCYGNVYRSAFAGAYLAQRLSGVEVRSCGFHPVSGRSSPERYIQMCERLGVSLHAHRSEVIEQHDLSWADVIVLMDRHNWARLDAMGAAPEKLVWLGSLTSGSVEIADPYTMDDTGAETVLQRLRDAAECLVGELNRRTSSL